VCSLQAIIACTHALRIDEAHPKALFRRGVAYLETGECGLARDDLSRALAVQQQAGKAAEVAAIKSELARVTKAVAHARELERAQYAGMFRK
jgi:lipoprotein NlpI